MIHTSVHPINVVHLLNELLEGDPDAMNALFNHRVPCNLHTANHPTVQVAARSYFTSGMGPIDVEAEVDPRTYAVGILGVLNGIFGTLPEDSPNPSHGAIVAMYENGRLKRFQLSEGVPLV